LLGPETGNYLGTGDHVARTIAASGLRLVLDEHRTTTTPTLKSGKPGKTKVAYGDVDVATKWLWRFVDGAKTAGELYGRVLVVFAAQHYASQLVLPNSQRRCSVLPRSHKDVARKAFERVTKRVLPATHVRLQRALAAEARSYGASIGELEEAVRRARTNDSTVGEDAGRGRRRLRARRDPVKGAGGRRARRRRLARPAAGTLRGHAPVRISAAGHRGHTA